MNKQIRYYQELESKIINLVGVGIEELAEIASSYPLLIRADEDKVISIYEISKITNKAGISFRSIIDFIDGR